MAIRVSEPMNECRILPMTQAMLTKARPVAGKTESKVASSMTPDTDWKQGEPTDSQTDLQLVRKVRNGDRAAFDLLVVKYQSRVASIISRYVYDSQEVMDLTQETFVKAFRAIERFRGDSAFYTWLYRIAVNTAKNFLEARGRRPQGSADVADAENFDDGGRLRDVASPERLLQREQLQKALSSAIADLPEELRSAFLLREYDGLSYEDIARVLECPIGAVRSRIFRAREAIDRQLAPMINHSATYE